MDSTFILEQVLAGDKGVYGDGGMFTDNLLAVARKISRPWFGMLNCYSV